MSYRVSSSYFTKYSDIRTYLVGHLWTFIVLIQLQKKVSSKPRRYKNNIGTILIGRYADTLIVTSHVQANQIGIKNQDTNSPLIIGKGIEEYIILFGTISLS